ncbi:uncharacterized protein [Procambarus clarkii]|uniref:uncharacterized protein n=1 Tax=Procambarus clarkii TaxID=6728 RepID=UPI003743FA35
MQPDKLQMYHAVVQQQLANKFIEVVEEDNHKTGHYLPHHTVLKDSVTTPIRIVFNCSAKLKADSMSLNDYLQTGPSLTQKQQEVVLRFCSGVFAFTADISIAFLRVGLQETDRDFTKLRWVKDPQDPNSEVITYRFASVLFGATSSPFLLQATLDTHLKKSNSPYKTEISNNLYIDNFQGTTNDENKLVEIYHETNRELLGANMPLQSWASNNKQLNQIIEEEFPDYKVSHKLKVLGVLAKEFEVGETLLEDLQEKSQQLIPDYNKLSIPQFPRNNLGRNLPTNLYVFCEAKRMVHKDNPAGYLSRGLTLKQLVKTEIWFNGTQWLVISQWPQQKPQVIVTNITTPVVHPEPPRNLAINPHHYSNLSKLLRVTEMVFDFINKMGIKYRFPSSIKYWVKQAQQQTYGKEYEHLPEKLSKSLGIWLDSDNYNILRCGRRLLHAEINLDMKNPILLPRHHIITKLIVLHYHEHNTLHGGELDTLTELRQRFWLPRGRKTVKSLIKSCVVCKRYDARVCPYPGPPPLPKERVVHLRPLKPQKINLTELQTLVVEIEARVNNRLLTYLSEDFSQREPLSPSHLIHGGLLSPLISIEDEDLADPSCVKVSDLVESYRHFSKVIKKKNEVWTREYLTALRAYHYGAASPYNKVQLKRGDLVLVDSDILRSDSPIGKIVDIHPDRNGILRIVKV